MVDDAVRQASETRAVLLRIQEHQHAAQNHAEKNNRRMMYHKLSDNLAITARVLEDVVKRFTARERQRLASKAAPAGGGTGGDCGASSGSVYAGLNLGNPFLYMSGSDLPPADEAKEDVEHSHSEFKKAEDVARIATAEVQDPCAGCMDTHVVEYQKCQSTTKYNPCAKQYTGVAFDNHCCIVKEQHGRCLQCKAQGTRKHYNSKWTDQKNSGVTVVEFQQQ